MLSWLKSDPERRLGLAGRRFTRVSGPLSAAAGLALAAAFYGVLSLAPSEFKAYSDVFTRRGPTPYAITFAAFWALAILVIKGRKLALQQKALDCVVVPEAADFVLSSATVDEVVERIYAAVDDPKHFILFDRVAVALSNLRNLGRVTDVDEILRSRADYAESIMESSYGIVRGLIWAIPVLGFIGTVLGLSSAIGGFGNVLATSDDMSEITAKLQDVTGGLATAFDTTLIALIAALALQMYATVLRKSEEEFLDSCSEYCQRHIVNRLRIMPYHADEA